jgi:hypothetical protein
MAKIAKEIDKQYGSLPKFAEQVWSHLGGDVAHGAGEEALWNEIQRVCVDLLGKSDGDKAAKLLRDKGFFSIVFPD